MSSQFRRQLANLEQVIGETERSYVRCLKPNDSLEPVVFDEGRVTEQLRCGGVKEAVRVGRMGYPERYLHTEFVERYGAVGGGGTPGGIVGAMCEEGGGGRFEGEVSVLGFAASLRWINRV